MKCPYQVKNIGAFGAMFMIALVIGCVLAVKPAHAVTAAELEAEAQSTLTQLYAMQDTLDQASQQYFEALEEYRVACEQRDATQEHINELTAEIASIQERLGARARDMYRNGAASVLDLLLGAATFDEFTQNWDLLNRVNESDATLSVQVQDLRQQSEAEKAEYGRQAQLAEEKSEAASEAYQQAEALIAEMQATYEALTAEAQQLYAAEQAAAYAQQVNTGGYVNDDGTVTDIATGQVYASATEYSAATGNAIVDRAMAMLGSAYVWGGVGGSSGGFDCSGFVSYALTGQNTRLGTTATFANWNQVSDPQPGDVCVIHNGENQHTGIYIGDGQMVHAGSTSTGVIVSNVQDGMIYVRQ